jgi:hypothetical protein
LSWIRFVSGAWSSSPYVGVSCSRLAALAGTEICWHDVPARPPPTLTRKGQGHGHVARVSKIVEPTSPRPCNIRGSHASNVPSGPPDQPPCNVKCNIYSIRALATTFAALVAPALSKSFQRNLQPNTIEFRAHQLRQRPLPSQSTLDSHSTKAIDLLMIWPC